MAIATKPATAVGVRAVIVVAEGSLPLNRLVVGHLLDRVPATEVAVTATDPQAVADLAELGVEVRPEHVGDPTAGAMSFLEGDRVLLDSRFDTTDLLDTVLGAAPAHVVLISKVAPNTSRQKWHDAHEGRVRRARVPFTFLRKNVDSEAFVPAAELALQSGEFVSSFGGGLVAPAARTDYAEAAAVVLTGKGYESRVCDITGPLGLKDLGIASVLSQLAARNIELRQVPTANLGAELTNAGASADVVAELEILYQDISANEWSTASERLVELIGHPRLTLLQALASALGV